MDAHSDFLKTLANILHTKCIEEGYSYRRLAEKANIAHTSVRRYLRGERDIPSTSFEQLSRALGLTPWKVYKQAEEELRACRSSTPSMPQAPTPPVPDEDGNYHFGNLPLCKDDLSLVADTNPADVELEKLNETDWA